MDQIKKLNRIDLEQLNQEQYFQALLQEIYNRKLFSSERIEALQLELIDLLGKEVERYTNGESSSVPVEKAQAILLSVTYSIGLYLKSFKDPEEVLKLLNTERVSTLFHKGMDAVTELKVSAAKLLAELQKNMLMINNYSYRDTISAGGISEFFHDYNIEFGAHEMAGNIDYQLCIPVTDVIGVEYIYEYIHRLTIENDFIKQFPEQNITMLLNGFHKDSEHMLINIFELVLTNALGRRLLDLSIRELTIPASDCEWLMKRLVSQSREELIKELEGALNEISEELSLDYKSTAYAKIILPQLAKRIRHNVETNTLKEIFISFVSGTEREEVYIDGSQMEDESLRELIDELRGITLISDKMARIREKVRSLEDMAELFEESFYPGEYEKVFTLLSRKEIEILIGRIKEEAGTEADEDYIPEKEWQKVLFLKYQK